MILHEVITTEKVPFNYRVAGLGSRFLAWLVDAGLLLVILCIGMCMGTVVEIGRAGLGTAVRLSAIFVMQFGYFQFFEWLWHGQTPGKLLMNIRVVTWEGTSISFLQSAARNILRVVDGFPIPYLIGTFVAICNREHRRLGDLAGGTLVVFVERRLQPIPAPTTRASDVEREWRAQVRQKLQQFNREQKQTVLDLCIRRDQLRLSERARLFRSVAEYLQSECGLPQELYQSDEKFVLAFAAEVGERGGAAEPATVGSP